MLVINPKRFRLVLFLHPLRITTHFNKCCEVWYPNSFPPTSTVKWLHNIHHGTSWGRLYLYCPPRTDCILLGHLPARHYLLMHSLYVVLFVGLVVSAIFFLDLEQWRSHPVKGKRFNTPGTCDKHVDLMQFTKSCQLNTHHMRDFYLGCAWYRWTGQLLIHRECKHNSCCLFHRINACQSLHPVHMNPNQNSK